MEGCRCSSFFYCNSSPVARIGKRCGYCSSSNFIARQRFNTMCTMVYHPIGRNVISARFNYIPN